MKKMEFTPINVEQMQRRVEQFMIQQHEYEKKLREQRAQEEAKIQEYMKALGCKSYQEFYSKIKEINQILADWRMDDCPY